MPMTLIQSQTLSGSAASVTFSNIPQTPYKTLVLKVSARADTASFVCIVKPNNDATLGATRYLQGNGAAASSSTASSVLMEIIDGSTATANTFGSAEWLFPNYASNAYKAVSSDGVSENNGTTAYQRLSAQLWSSTTAITSLVIVDQGGGNLVANSSFTLYGLS